MLDYMFIPTISMLGPAESLFVRVKNYRTPETCEMKVEVCQGEGRKEHWTSRRKIKN
jgi:hypothetical protein